MGSGGMIAANAVINSPPDGYTIMFVAPNNVIGTTLYKNLPFVFLRRAGERSERPARPLYKCARRTLA